MWTKILVALTGPVLDWLSKNIGKLITGMIDSYKNKKEERVKNKKQKKRAELVRQLQLAKESGDDEEFRRITIALTLHDND